MSSPSKKIDISENIKRSAERTIILNVGGIKYETYASTLTSYPDTLLGTMFQDKNRALLHPQAGNTYFFDRNGYAFRYIMEFYRTGKLLLSERDKDKVTFVTLDEIEKEIDYFHIPVTEEEDVVEFDDDNLMIEKQTNSRNKNNVHHPSPASVLIHKHAGAKVDQFINALENLIYEAMGNFEEWIELKFFSTILDVETYWNETEPTLKFSYIPIIKPYGVIGYYILEKFSKEIQSYFETTMQSISFQSDQVTGELTSIGNCTNYYKISINIKDNYTKEDIIIHTRLDNYRVS
ncbi:2065_t:CDS:2 [Funneliformis mosseae]|uniref:2065_t:CDS:1 n=1 Tax=Funneliformis mosseae TaxID=27381 RepID=A0A9N9G5M0_FUNMO|nr:2065_t:CDS:2 [Funneliformis mosseae]